MTAEVLQERACGRDMRATDIQEAQASSIADWDVTELAPADFDAFIRVLDNPGEPVPAVGTRKTMWDD